MAPLPVRQDPAFGVAPPPEGPHAALKDGSIVQGALDEPAKVRIRTAAGTVEIPAASIRTIRVAPLREEELRDIGGRIDRLIEQLGHADYEKRQAAQRELLAIGAAAAERLKARVDDPDFEIRASVQEILGKLSTAGSPPAIERDEISGPGFFARGWLETKELRIRTDGGARRVPLAEVSSLWLDAPAGGGALPAGSFFLTLKDGTRLPGRWTDGALEMETPTGRKTVAAPRILEIRPWGSDIRIRTEEGFLQGRLLSFQGTFETPFGRLDPPVDAIAGISAEPPVAIKTGDVLEGGIRVAAAARDPASGHVYAVLQDPKGMDRASAEAAARKLGAHLATISSAEENRAVAALASPPEGLDVLICHIGLSDPGMQGQWRWCDGEPVRYANWAQGEPNRMGGEDVVEIYFSRDGRNGQWNDVSSGVPRHGCVVEFDR